MQSSFSPNGRPDVGFLFRSNLVCFVYRFITCLGCYVPRAANLERPLYIAVNVRHGPGVIQEVFSISSTTRYYLLTSILVNTLLRAPEVSDTFSQLQALIIIDSNWICVSLSLWDKLPEQWTVPCDLLSHSLCRIYAPTKN
jgi:hypothetical protein